MAISRRERFVLWIKDKKRKTVRDGKTLDCFSSVTARGNLCLKSPLLANVLGNGE